MSCRATAVAHCQEPPGRLDALLQYGEGRGIVLAPALRSVEAQDGATGGGVDDLGR